jgi:hypothetical protein
MKCTAIFSVEGGLTRLGENPSTVFGQWSKGCTAIFSVKDCLDEADQAILALMLGSIGGNFYRGPKLHCNF